MRPIESRFGVRAPSVEKVVEETKARSGETIVSSGSDRARDVGTMIVVVERIAVHRDGVEPVSSGVAVDCLIPDDDTERRGRGPYVGRKIRMSIVDAGINDTDDVGARTDRDVPRRGDVDIGSGQARRAVDRLPRVEQTPQLRE